MKILLMLACLSMLALGLTAEARDQVPTDPTRPPSAAEVRAFFGEGTDSVDARESLQLQSILVSNQRRSAIINDRRVSIGDRIGNAEVIAIDADRVRLRRDGAELNLTLAGPQLSIRPSESPEKRHD